MTTRRRNYEDLGEIELPAELASWIEAAVEQAERDLEESAPIEPEDAQ